MQNPSLSQSPTQKQSTPTLPSLNTNTKEIMRDKITIRGFKSLNRKGIHSPKNNNALIQVINGQGKENTSTKLQDISNKENKENKETKNTYTNNKQNIKDSINSNQNTKLSLANNIASNKKENHINQNQTHAHTHSHVYTYIKTTGSPSGYENIVQKYKKNISELGINSHTNKKRARQSQGLNTKQEQRSQKTSQQQTHSYSKNNNKLNADVQKQYKIQLFLPAQTQPQITSKTISTGTNANQLRASTTSTRNNISTRSNRSNRSNSSQKQNGTSDGNESYTHECTYKSTNKMYTKYENSPALNYASKANPKNQENATNLNTSNYAYTSPIKYSHRPASESTYLNSPYPNLHNNTIISQSVSKDGNYKVISRTLQGDDLKQAVEFEFNTNLKSKKQGQKDKEKNGNTSPRHKYILDPSRISNKDNGNIKAYAVNSNQGITRKYNEDRVSIILNINKNGVKASYFAIYDGHGGSNCCDFLTQNLHQYIFNSKKFPSNPRQAIIEGVKLAQEKFIEKVKQTYQQTKELDRSGSCAIIALVIEDECYIANVGDSRAVLSTCNGKPMYSLSRDHKPTDIGEQNRIIKEGGKIYRTEMIRMKNKEKNKDNTGSKKMIQDKADQQNKNMKNQSKTGLENQIIIGPLRVFPGKLSVTRTFGDIEAKQPQLGGIKNCISTDPEICKYSLTGKQDFILLGCDGIFQKLDSQQVIEQAWRAIRKNKASSIHEAAGSAAQSIIKLCMDRKSTDNLTTIMICLGSLGLGANLSDYASA